MGLKLDLHGFSNREINIIYNMVDDYIKLMKVDVSNMQLTIANIPARVCPITCPKRLNV